MRKEKFKNKYRIDSARLKGYDYSSSGGYFLTIVNNPKIWERDRNNKKQNVDRYKSDVPVKKKHPIWAFLSVIISLRFN